MPDKVEVDLASVLDISKVEALYEELESIANGVNDVVLKADKVERIDTSCMQALLSFKQALAEHGGVLQWIAPSENLVAVANRLGLIEELGIPAV